MKEHFTVIGLTNDQVASGMLSVMSNIISNQFMLSAHEVTANRQIKYKQKWCTILFDNPFTFSRNEKYNSEYVHYLNDNALELIEGAGIVLNKLGDEAEAPKDAGIMINIPVYVAS